MKEVNALCIENYQILMKGREDTNAWKAIPCLWTERVNIVKMSRLSQTGRGCPREGGRVIRTIWGGGRVRHSGTCPVLPSLIGGRALPRYQQEEELLRSRNVCGLQQNVPFFVNIWPNHRRCRHKTIYIGSEKTESGKGLTLRLKCSPLPLQPFLRSHPALASPPGVLPTQRSPFSFTTFSFKSIRVFLEESQRNVGSFSFNLCDGPNSWARR